MKTNQSYETTIFDPETYLSAHVYVAPARSLGSLKDLSHDQELLDLLKLTPVSDIRPADLPDALAWALLELPPDALNLYLKGVSLEMSELRKKLRDTPQYRFAEQVVLERLVPSENSPLTTESISAILSASGVSLGALAGFMVAGSTPLLFFLVPTGMILFGAAAAVGTALEQGLRERLNMLISGKKLENVRSKEEKATATTTKDYTKHYERMTSSQKKTDDSQEVQKNHLETKKAINKFINKRT